MTRVSHSDWDKLSKFLQRLYAQTDLEHLPQTMLEGLRELVDCEHAGYNEVGADGKTVAFSLVPWVQEVVDLTPVVSKHLHQHPQYQYFSTHADCTPRQTLDFMSSREFKRLAIYQEFFRHADTGNQLVMPLVEFGTGPSIGFTINRKQGLFSERDCQLLSLARPHLIQARENAIAFYRASHKAEPPHHIPAPAGSTTIQLDAAGQPAWLTPKAAHLLETYFPGSLKSAGHLPESLLRWLGQTRETLASGALVTSPVKPLQVWRDHACLTIRYQAQPPETAVLLLTEQGAVSPRALGAPLGLTARETEVLHWLAEGKTNPEIGLILNISPRTVHKHVEHLFNKLGVSTRQAAARHALNWQGLLA